MENKLQSGFEDDQNIRQIIQEIIGKNSIERVLLVNPPDADSDLFQVDVAKRGRYTNYSPYGLGMLAATMRKIGIEVKICNLNHTVLKAAKNHKNGDFNHDKVWKTELEAILEEFMPDLVGVTCMFTMTHKSFQHVCEFIHHKGHVIAAGGVHVSNDVNRVLDDIPAIAFAFLREGEQALNNFIEFINNDAPVSILGQIVINSRIGGNTERNHLTRECPPASDMINLAPAIDLLEINEYSSVGTIGAFYYFKPKDTVFSTVLSNRGCRAQCTFCSVRNFNGKGVRGRDYMLVVDEIEQLVVEEGMGHFMWLDDDLLKDHKRALSMFSEIERRNLPVTWDATNGLIASSCSEELIDAMAKSGCIAVNIGMESGNRKILREIRKPGTLENFIKAAQNFRKFPQIHTSVLLMLGFPGETFSMINDTIDVAKEMDCDWYRITPLQPLPNTPIYDSMIAQGLIKPDVLTETRFMGGSYGKQAEIEKGLRMVDDNFFTSFNGYLPDAIPSSEQITDIWFYANYQLNFKRVFYEKRPEKINQLNNLFVAMSDIIAPENGFALYFLGYLEYLAKGKTSENLINRLKQRLETSEYWSQRLTAFGLSVEDLVLRKFPIG